MAQFWCQSGDVIFYFDARSIIQVLITAGETLEEHADGPWPYHVAVALSKYDKLEADGRDTAINPIVYRNCVICRPKYPNAEELNRALAWGRAQVGKLYGWPGVIDQGLRDATHDRVHLPRSFVEWSDAHWPFCSSLARGLLTRAGIDTIPRYPPPSPADIWRVLRGDVVSVCDGDAPENTT